MTGKTRLEVVYPNVKAWSWSPVLFEDVSAPTSCIEPIMNGKIRGARILAASSCPLLLLRVFRTKYGVKVVVGDQRATGGEGSESLEDLGASVRKGSSVLGDG